MSGRRSKPSTGRFLAAVGAVDLGLIVAVLSWGLHTHAMEPIQNPHYAARTIGPFLFGWVIWAPLIGAYRTRVVGAFRQGFPRALLAWFAAAVTGAAVRATPLISGGAPGIFIAVVFGVGAVVLLPWRALVCLSLRA